MAQLALPPSGIRLSDVFQLAKAYVFGNGYSNTSGIVALAGGGQTGATPLKSFMSQIDTCVSNGDSVILPKAVSGTLAFIANNGAANLAIFPDLGSTINNGSANASVTLNTNADLVLFCAKNGNWRTNT